MRSRILPLVYSAMDEVNQQLPADRRLLLSEAAVLTGAEAQLDSLSFLTLVVTVEERVSAGLGLPVQLAARLAESEGPPPRTVGALVDLLAASLEGAGRG